MDREDISEEQQNEDDVELDILSTADTDSVAMENANGSSAENASGTLLCDFLSYFAHMHAGM